MYKNNVRGNKIKKSNANTQLIFTRNLASPILHTILRNILPKFVVDTKDTEGLTSSLTLTFVLIITSEMCTLFLIFKCVTRLAKHVNADTNNFYSLCMP